MRERGGTRGRARSQRRVHREGSARARERSGARGATDSNRGARPRSVRPARRPRARASAPASAPIRPVPRAEKSRAGIARAHRVGFSHHAPELRRGGDDGGAGASGSCARRRRGAREKRHWTADAGRFGGWWCECGYAGAAARAEGFRIKPAGPRRALAASRRFQTVAASPRARSRTESRSEREARIISWTEWRALIGGERTAFFDSTRPFFFFGFATRRNSNSALRNNLLEGRKHARPIGTRRSNEPRRTARASDYSYTTGKPRTARRAPSATPAFGRFFPRSEGRLSSATSPRPLLARPSSRPRSSAPPRDAPLDSASASSLCPSRRSRSCRRDVPPRGRVRARTQPLIDPPSRRLGGRRAPGTVVINSIMYNAPREPRDRAPLPAAPADVPRRPRPPDPRTRVVDDHLHRDHRGAPARSSPGRSPPASSAPSPWT